MLRDQNQCILTLGVNLMWIFFVIWILFGFIPVVLLAVLINHGITRYETARS